MQGKGAIGMIHRVIQLAHQRPILILVVYFAVQHLYYLYYFLNLVEALSLTRHYYHLIMMIMAQVITNFACDKVRKKLVMRKIIATSMTCN